MLLRYSYPKAEKEFELLRERIDLAVSEARDHWELLKSMNEAQGEFGSQMSQSQTFWHLTFIAHRDSVLAHLCRLYDKTDGTLSLSRFIETIKLDRGLFSDAKFKKRLKRNPHFETLVLDRDMKISTLNSELKKVLPSNRDVRKLHYLRNKVIAHTDAEVVIRGFAPGRSWPSSALIEKLLDRAAKITGTYSLHFKASLCRFSVKWRESVRR